MVSPKTELKFSFYFVLITYFNMKLYRIMAGKGVEIYQKKKLTLGNTKNTLEWEYIFLIGFNKNMQILDKIFQILELKLENSVF